ncbi:MAG: hypothetical protein R2877_03050 [Bdellovibrionota bacterium]
MLLNSYQNGVGSFLVWCHSRLTAYNDCLNWTSNDGGEESSVAVTNETNADAVAAAPAMCDAMAHLACAEQ